MEVKVNLGKDSYPIYIQKGILEHVIDYIQPIYQGKKIMIISDDQVYGYYGEKLFKQLESCYEVGHIIVPHGEQSKRFDILPSLYSQLLSFQLTRSDLIIALGGGVIGDLAGFVASTFLRGVKFVQIPTSLLAQVDSSVGGKVAVDLPEGKNLVGAFKHPLLVLIDPLTLKTLDERFIHDGMGEVIKYGCIFDHSLFQRLASYLSFEELYEDIDEIIYRCVDLKRDVVEKDLFDFGDRLALNFGHTLGHALEQYYHYEKYSHGEAVSIGMVQLTYIAEIQGLTPKGTSQLIKEVVEKYELPTQAHVSTQELKKAMALDKKNIHQKLSYVLLKEIGQCYIYPSDLTFIDVVKEI
ncbi:MAG: 3-dehydroquinate synthase [Coprobacillus cateniformis]|uniref:3-dehydroquinate synthase n=1 Tax=Longibaculum muris TaxID=1796628 RepID=UPI003AB2E6A7|nr:3-dehydroquinate synthase [Coprobacillus cateniformis]